MLGGNKGSNDSSFEDKFHQKSRECDNLLGQLKKEQDAVRALRAAAEQATPADGGTAVAEAASPQEPPSPKGGGFFSSLFDSSAKREDGVLAICQEDQPAADGYKAALLQSQLEEVQEKLQQAEETTRKKLQDLVQNTTSALASRQETCGMLAEQRAGALEQLSQLQVDNAALNAELEALKEDEGQLMSDAQELEKSQLLITSLEEQVQDVVAANKDLFTQTAEAIEENNMLNLQIEEQSRHCDQLEEALVDAQQSTAGLQDAHDSLKAQVEEVLMNDMKRAERQSQSADQDIAMTINNMQTCIAVLQSSKAVSDTEARTSSLWRARCIELEAQRDTALEVALCLTKANDAEEATDMVKSYLG
eukprot:TRINITY_DN5504_c0_g1_i1.p1 TRINITY_DN5504_c0_g1~~TRINITY_DN5504_c0_g1_i1.p1  ORF type:complete len:363 (+),score=141.74 TRINITY_DN5504_c0_g1_i1:473-1561(+)